MDDKKLNALLAAVRLGSLSKAANELGYTQSGLTLMMKSLEAELGCPILARNYSGVKLTPKGEYLLPYIEEAANALKRLQAEAATGANDLHTAVRIGTYPSIAKGFLPQMVKDFKKENPAIPIEITVGDEHVQDLISSVSIDIAVVEESCKGGNVWTPLFEDQYYAVVPASSALSSRRSISVQELLEYPFIMSQYTELKSKLKLLAGKPAQQNIAINSQDDASLLSLVAQGLGVTILPATTLTDLTDLAVAIHLEPALRRTIGIVMPQQMSKYCTEFVEFLKERVRGYAPGLE